MSDVTLAHRRDRRQVREARISEPPGGTDREDDGLGQRSVGAAALLEAFLRDDPGTPLSTVWPNMPSGSPLRLDGESHLGAWARIVRTDPCALCGEAAGSLDHIEPRSLPTRGIGSAHSWLNYAGMCDRCNGGKGARGLLDFMARRRGTPGRRHLSTNRARPEIDARDGR